jgi:acetyl-CoA carboxylase biotin carboxyl carrier protein
MPGERRPSSRGPAGSVPDRSRADASGGNRASGGDRASGGGRAADHAAIDRLADELVPALIAKLSATGLGEIEVGEEGWTVRVRRPADAATSHNRRSTDRPSRSQPGHAGHGHGPGGFEGHRGAREARLVAGSGPAPASSNGSGPAAATSGPTGVTGGLGSGSGVAPGPGGDGPDAHRALATSPAVGIFQPRPETKTGTRVRSGDRLGAVDVLGVPEEVVAPADGIVGATLVEPGQAVEYGQELIVIELAAARVAERPAGAIES